MTWLRITMRIKAKADNKVPLFEYSDLAPRRSCFQLP